MRKVYNKLVRDRMPEIIRQNGDTCRTVTMTEIEFQVALRQKIVEEAEEVMQAVTEHDLLKELADLYEVVETFLQINSITIDMVRIEKERRREQRGGFTQRIKLLWTE